MAGDPMTPERCPNCHDAHVAEIPHSPRWTLRHGREFTCRDCGYVWPAEPVAVVL